MTSNPLPSYLPYGTPPLRLAYRQTQERDARPGLVWLSGFKSDMCSTKASFIAQYAQREGLGLLRFDYSGHGESEGLFEEGTIGAWTAQACYMIRTLTLGPQILIASSMGAWIALLIAQKLAQWGETDRLAGMIGIAPAVDFTQNLIWDRLPEDIKDELRHKGSWLLPSAPGFPPIPITFSLIEEAKAHLLLGKRVRSYCPFHLLQGTQDAQVPLSHALLIAEHILEDPFTLTLIPGGDHRLSRPQDLTLLTKTLENMLHIS